MIRGIFLALLGQNLWLEEQEGLQATEIHSASGKASEVWWRSKEPKEVSNHNVSCGLQQIFGNVTE